MPGGWGRVSAVRETSLEATGMGRREDSRSPGAPIGFREPALDHSPTFPRDWEPAHLINCPLCTQHNLLVSQRPHKKVDSACNLPRRKGSWCKRSCKPPPLAAWKWGQLCLGFAENRENMRELKILAPQIFPGCQQVCQMLAEGKPWLTPPSLP